MFARVIALAALLFALDAMPAMAQEERPYENTFARSGRVTMPVYIWGSVGNAGIWNVEPNVDLIELLSAARVTGMGQDQFNVRQRVRVRLYRNNPGGREMVYDTFLHDVLERNASYPQLQEGDVLFVETVQRQRLSLQMVSTIVGTASSLWLLYLRLSQGR
jgi:hypothetical protein